MHLLLREKAPAPVLHVRGDPLHLPEQYSCPDRHSAVSTGSPRPTSALQDAPVSPSPLYPAASNRGEGVMETTSLGQSGDIRTNSLPCLAGKANFGIGSSIL